MDRLHQLIKNKGIKIAKGLSDDEFVRLEAKFQIKFPPDLRRFLAGGLPVSGNFVDWRASLTSRRARDGIRSRLDWPLEGMLFDLKHADFWIDRWGEKPPTFDEREAIARKHFATYPKLIPVCSHRYLPMEPLEAGNPIFSVYQMDVIYYGYDLASYLAKEFRFKLPDRYQAVDKPKKIRFWSWWVDEWPRLEDQKLKRDT